MNNSGRLTEFLNPTGSTPLSGRFRDLFTTTAETVRALRGLGPNRYRGPRIARDDVAKADHVSLPGLSSDG
jgi:hypothetical protein